MGTSDLPSTSPGIHFALISLGTKPLRLQRTVLSFHFCEGASKVMVGSRHFSLQLFPAHETSTFASIWLITFLGVGTKGYRDYRNFRDLDSDLRRIFEIWDLGPGLNPISWYPIFDDYPRKIV